MTAPDDIAPLLGYGDVPDVGFRQGQVMAWNEATGTNTINLGGVMLSDLPVLNLGEFSLLQEGDIVGLLRFKTSYFILGRIIPPRTPDQNRATVAFETKKGSTNTQFSISPTQTTRVTLTLTPPSWADEAVLMVSQMTVGVNTSSPGIPDYLVVQSKVNGGGLKGMVARAEAGIQTGATCVDSVVLSPLGPTITVEGTVWKAGATGTWAAPNSGNDINLSVIAIYRRTD